jgi:hypothetical protein
MATLGYLICPFSVCTPPNPLAFTCCVALPFSLPYKFGMYIVSNTSLPAIYESIQYYRNHLITASHQMSPNHQQPLSPSTEVQIEPVSNGSAPR